MTTVAVHDQRLLREEAYADDTHLDVRYRTHQLYTVDPVDFGRWTLERLAWQGDERVLDVGCARGDLVREMARRHDGWRVLVGSDISPGMVTKGSQLANGWSVRFFVSDAQSLPLPSEAFDVVMARHMLYHVPDIQRAVAETARVLCPGGRFLATTNSAHTMPEYRALWDQAAERFPGMLPPTVPEHRFCLESGPAFLEPDFDQVEIHTLPGVLRFPSAQPFMDYFASTRAFTTSRECTDTEWQAVLGFVRGEVTAIIARHGHLDVTKVTGAIVGVKKG